MALERASSIPPYNIFRVSPPGSVDVEDVRVCLLYYPFDLSEFIFGALSLLTEVNFWTEDGIGSYSVVDYVNQYVECEMDICDFIADCIRNSPETRDAIREIINDGSGNYNPTNVDSGYQNSMDCVYGGILKLVDYCNDTVLSMLTVIEASADLIEDIIEILPFGGLIAAEQIISVTAEFTISILEATYTDPDWSLDRACDLFCLQLETDDPNSLLADTVSAWFASYDVVVPDEFFTWALLARLGTTMNDLLEQFVFGGDECDDDWLLCSCVMSDSVDIPSDGTSVDSTITLLEDVQYVISVHDTVQFASSPDRFSDGVYADVTTTPQIIGTNYAAYDLGSGYVKFPEYSPYTDRGYSFTIVGTGSVATFQYFDADYSGNSGALTVVIAKAS